MCVYIYRIVFLLTNVDVTLGRAIKFQHLCDIESLYEFTPYLRPQPVTDNHSDIVLLVFLLRRYCHDVSAHFPDILANLFFKIIIKNVNTTRSRDLNQYVKIFVFYDTHKIL